MRTEHSGESNCLDGQGALGCFYTIRPQPATEDPVFDDATALDTPVDMSAWQPALGEPLIRHVLLQRQLLAAGVLVGIDKAVLSTLKRALAMVEDNSRSVTLAPSLALQDHDTSVMVSGAQLTIPDLVRVARQGAHVRLTTDEACCIAWLPPMSM